MAKSKRKISSNPEKCTSSDQLLQWNQPFQWQPLTIVKKKGRYRDDESAFYKGFYGESYEEGIRAAEEREMAEAMERFGKKPQE
jgi:hypothetical protein